MSFSVSEKDTPPLFRRRLSLLGKRIDKSLLMVVLLMPRKEEDRPEASNLPTATATTTTAISFLATSNRQHRHL